jgi:ABC-type phosphate transport system substrate-binding protein
VKRLLLTGVCGVLLAVAAGCQTPTEARPSEPTGEEAWSFASGVTAENYPRVNGSTSTRPLGKLIAARAICAEAELFRPGVGMMPFIGSREPVAGFPVGFRDVDEETLMRLNALSHHEGTHQSYLRLLGLPLTAEEEHAEQRRAELALIARGPSEDELEAAKELGVEFDVRPVARDAFVFIVNAQNPVRSLTLEQLRAVFRGEVTNWTEVGGEDKPIEAFTRDRNSGSEELMRDLVMEGGETIRAPESVLEGMMGPIDTVAENPNAIAYSVYYYEQFMRPNMNNRLLAVDGVLPTAETIASGEYSLTTDVCLVTRQDLDPESPAARLREWLLTQDGQQVVEDSGYVPVLTAD